MYIQKEILNTRYVPIPSSIRFRLLAFGAYAHVYVRVRVALHVYDRSLFPALREPIEIKDTYDRFPCVLIWCRLSDYINIYITLITISRERKEIIRFIPDI